MSARPRRLSVLVLGAGGNVSQGIMKALAGSTLDCRVVAGCVSPLGAGLHLADRSYLTPYASDAAFADWLVETSRAEAVDFVLSGTEPVLEALASLADRLRDETGATPIVARPEQLELGTDKLLTARWLARHDLPYARTEAAADEAAVRELADSAGFPLIVKPRRGKGAAGVFEVRSAEELKPFLGRSDLIVQELLGDDASEYTVGCLADAAGRPVGTVALRRDLEAGTTFRAEAGAFPEVRRVAERVAARLAAAGPLNVQLRVHRGEPVPFELNVRFSGTTPIRARMGFNEVEAVIRERAFGEHPAPVEVTRGRVVRYWNEIYVRDEAYERLREGRPLDAAAEAPGLVEDWGSPR